MATRLRFRAWEVAVILQAALGLPLCGQREAHFVLTGPTSAAGQSTSWRKFAAVHDLVAGFNGIGRNAADLRLVMSVADAEAFDAVMLDLMAAIAALPSVGIARSGDPTEMAPRAPRSDRITQIRPDLLALDRFFTRLQGVPASKPNSRMLASARKNVQRMLSALPLVLPTVSAQPDQLPAK